MKKKYTISTEDRLKALRKANRETMHTVKPMVTTDKKKKYDKESCRKFKHTR